MERIQKDYLKRDEVITVQNPEGFNHLDDSEAKHCVSADQNTTLYPFRNGNEFLSIRELPDEGPKRLHITTNIPFGKISVSRATSRSSICAKDETSSQMSELTMSVVDAYYKASTEEVDHAENMLQFLSHQLYIEELQKERLQYSTVHHDDAVTVREGGDPSSYGSPGALDQISVLNMREAQDLQQRIRMFYARNSAYERAVKLSRLIEENEDQETDKTYHPLYFLIAILICTMSTLVPYFVYIGENKPDKFVGSLVRRACMGKEYSDALSYTVGCSTPLLVEMLTNSRILSYFGHRKAFKRRRGMFDIVAPTRFFCTLTVAMPAIIQLFMIANNIPVEAFATVALFWQFNCFAGIGTKFFVQYCPHIVTLNGYPRFGQYFMFCTFLLFNIGCIVQAQANLVVNFDEIYRIAIPFQCLGACMYMWMIFQLYLKCTRKEADGKTALDPNSTTVVSVIRINSGFCAMLVLDYAIQLKILSVESYYFDEIIVCWHIYAKTVIVVLMCLLPLSLAKRSIKRTKGALEQMLSISGSELVASDLPFAVEVPPNDDSSAAMVEPFSSSGSTICA